jgi:hypothetical protein
MRACIRCGQPYNSVTDDCRAPCVHSNTMVHYVDAEHARRVQVAYAFGKRFNPDHDTTSYYRQTIDAGR